MQELEFIEAIKAGGPRHDRALSTIYSKSSYEQAVIGYFRKKGLSTTDAQTLWTDLVIQFGKLVRNGKYEHQGNTTGYLMNLARYMFLNHLRSIGKHSHIDAEDINSLQMSVEPESMYPGELHRLLQTQLQRLGGICQDLLNLWSRDYSMAEIQKKLNIVSPEATRKRKHMCMKKLLQYVDSDSKLQSQLKSYLTK